MEAVAFFLASLRWQDIADLLLNSYILFRLYVLFRGTIVIRVLTGLAGLWIVQRLAEHFGLILTSWVVQAIIAAGALIIVIVFRSEIRAVLQTRDLKAVLWGFPRHAVQTSLEAIVEAVYELARRRIGALVVIPGVKDLEDLVQNGTPLDGRISRELLVSIFWPDNPVHDGAAVLRGDRVAQVGAILPLSRREDLPSHYGTRHRAAAGLTEQTDALVIVVSEESGRVSAARSGRLVPIEDNLALTRMIAQQTGQPGEVRRRRPPGLDYALAALVCLVLVGGIWFSCSRGQQTLTTLEVPVEFVNRDAGVEIVDTSATTLRLDLSGSGPLIRSLRPEQVKVQVDLRGADAGQSQFTLTGDMVRLPPGIRLKRIAPPSVAVALDAIREKTLPIQVDWVGRLPDDRRLASVSLDPPRTRVVGSQRELAEVATLYTEPVSLAGLETSGRLIVGLALPGGVQRVAEGAAARVTVDYVIAPRLP